MEEPPLCSTIQSLSNDGITVYKDPLIQTEIHGGNADQKYTDGATREPAYDEGPEVLRICMYLCSCTEAQQLILQ